MIKFKLLITLCILLWGLPALADKNQEGEETYEILQKGFITLEGKSNFFDFSGRAVKHEGILHEVNDLYTGVIQLRFSDIDFNLPVISGILQEQQEGIPKSYSLIKITLKDLKPQDLPTQITSNLSLRGITKQILINTKFTYISPVVKVEGDFTFKQTDFGMVPYSKAFVEVADQIQIKFKVFFCESHPGTPSYHANDEFAMKQLLSEENIKILFKDNYFGCSELETPPAHEVK